MFLSGGAKPPSIKRGSALAHDLAPLPDEAVGRQVCEFEWRTSGAQSIGGIKLDCLAKG